MSNGTSTPPPATYFTEANRAALQEAIATGTLHVSYDGKSVTYRSFDELREALATVTSALSNTPPRRRLLTRTRGDKGL